MEKKAFKAESQRLLDLMIHSIYTHKEIFLREIISNASDAIDKLCYLSLTDENVGLKREDFAITLSVDKENRTLTVSDNGIGMDADEPVSYTHLCHGKNLPFLVLHYHITQAAKIQCIFLMSAKSRTVFSIPRRSAQRKNSVR